MSAIRKQKAADRQAAKAICSEQICEAKAVKTSPYFSQVCKAFSFLTGNALQWAAMSELSWDALIMMSAIRKQKAADRQAAKAICSEQICEAKAVKTSLKCARHSPSWLEMHFNELQCLNSHQMPWSWCQQLESRERQTCMPPKLCAGNESLMQKRWRLFLVLSDVQSIILSYWQCTLMSCYVWNPISGPDYDVSN